MAACFKMTQVHIDDKNSSVSVLLNLIVWLSPEAYLMIGKNIRMN